jgi:hypothetical protein
VLGRARQAFVLASGDKVGEAAELDHVPALCHRLSILPMRRFARWSWTPLGRRIELRRQGVFRIFRPYKITEISV